MSREYINVPFAEKDKAKFKGARWDMEAKKWYVPEILGTEDKEYLRTHYGDNPALAALSSLVPKKNEGNTQNVIQNCTQDNIQQTNQHTIQNQNQDTVQKSDQHSIQTKNQDVVQKEYQHSIQNLNQHIAPTTDHTSVQKENHIAEQNHNQDNGQNAGSVDTAEEMKEKLVKMCEQEDNLALLYTMKRYGLPRESEVAAKILHRLNERKQDDYPIMYSDVVKYLPELTLRYPTSKILEWSKPFMTSGDYREKIRKSTLTQEQKELLLLILPA